MSKSNKLTDRLRARARVYRALGQKTQEQWHKDESHAPQRRIIVGVLKILAVMPHHLNWPRIVSSQPKI